MAKWKDMKVETPRDRLKKRRRMEQERKERQERDKKKKIKIMIFSGIAAFIGLIILIVMFVSFSKEKAKEEKIEKTKKVSVIPIMGDFEIRQSPDDVYLNAESADDTLESGGAIRLFDNAKVMLDFGNDTIITMKNQAELSLDEMEVEGTRKAHIELFIYGGTTVIRKPSNRGSIIVRTNLGDIFAEADKLTVFKIENNREKLIRVAVKQGEVNVEAKDGYGKIIVSDAKAIVIDGTREYIETSKLEDVNMSLEGWD